MAKIYIWLKLHWQPLIFVLAGIALRVWNFHNSLYFIYDQGRDALVLEKIIHGNPVLVGPTSGLNGLFLGPLWYYLGVPGFLLSNGNPYGICLWYILLSCLALPLFWYLAHRLFRQKIWAVLCAIFLAIVPGSIQASVFVWNPLLSVPLMAGVVISFWKARTSRWWLGIGFLLLALTLQSEFAYAVFFLPVFFVLIPWIRQKFHWRDFAVAVAAIAVTGLPQVLFELRNHFIMTTSLLRSMSDKSQSVSWQALWSMRPSQLLSTSRLLLLGESYSLWMFDVLILLLLFLGILAFVQIFWRQRVESFAKLKSAAELRKNQTYVFLWLLILLCALIPYPFYMLWRGNHGYFFSYYVTPHFIFLVPVVMLGIREIWRLGQRIKLARVVAVACLLLLSVASFKHWDGVVFRPQNNAGLAKMVATITHIYNWHQQDADANQNWVVKTYTANVYTEQYDYLLSWYGRTHHITPPQTVLNGQEKTWYIIIESRDHASAFFFDPWYKAATQGGHKVRQEQIGVLTLETWKK